MAVPTANANQNTRPERLTNTPEINSPWTTTIPTSASGRMNYNFFI